MKEMINTSLFFLRHLKTRYNRDNLISGREDIDILKGQSIISLSASNNEYDIVLCSPLKRCLSTLSLLPNDCMKSIRYIDELSERNMGILEGLNKTEAQIRYPLLFCVNKIDVSADIPGGESIYEVQQRLKAIVAYIKSNPDENILICSHNQTLKILYFLLHEMPVTNDAWQCLNFPNGVLINVSDMKSNNI